MPVCENCLLKLQLPGCSRDTNFPAVFHLFISNQTPFIFTSATNSHFIL